LQQALKQDIPIGTHERFSQGKNSNGEANKLRQEDKAIHDWYRFVLSYPPHFVKSYIERFQLDSSHVILDPFCGTGTTLVECKKLGIPSVGVEVNPVAHFASSIKVDWDVDPIGLLSHANSVAIEALARIADTLTQKQPYREIAAEQAGLILKDSISPLPLHKTLVLQDVLRDIRDDRYAKHEALALAKALVRSISNLSFGPEVGVGKLKDDALVVESWLSEVRAQSCDLRLIRQVGETQAIVHHADARSLSKILEPNSIDAVITSPPYPNEKDYTRTVRLEAVLLGFINNKAELRSLKGNQVRSNTRGVYKADDDDAWVDSFPRIQEIAEEIERRRVSMGKTSGFERLYARVAKLYFGGMARHLADMRTVLRPGARLAYVVGDQASYLRVMIRTGQIIAEIAESLGYECMGIDLFRTRLATATREQLREEVVLLQWPR